jgi:LysM repeat protein
VSALDGTIKTPLGMVQKKTALLAIGGIAALGVVVWFRQKNQPQSAQPSDAEIDPATGFPYGSAEDAAALAQQDSFISPSPGGATTGGSGAYPPGTGFVSNGQWVQAVIEYMTTNGLVEDAGQLTSALGIYINGSPASDTNVNLIQQAIAVQGFPPVSGPSGYPPAINRAPVGTPPPTTTPPPVPKPTPKALPKRRYAVVVKFTDHNPPWNSYLSGIARRAQRTVSQLKSWNSISNEKLIFTKQRIWIDPPGSYSGSIEFKG